MILLLFYIFFKPFLRTNILSTNILITKKLFIRIFKEVHQNLKKNYQLNNLL